MTDPCPLIAVRDLRHRYPGAEREALAGIDLDIAAGSSFGLLGPNGAGKSTLLSLLTGIARPQQGEIRIDGRELRRERDAIRAIGALVPQEYAFYPALSGLENLHFFAGIYGLDRQQRRARIDQAVAICRLDEYLPRRAESYSGGVKRRLNLAIGLLNAPRILYLDEPTVGIDALSRHCIVEAIRALHRLGTTVVYTSHYMEEVEAICDEIAVIDRGRVVARDSVAALLGERRQRQLRIRLEQAPSETQRALWLAHPGAALDGDRLTLPLPDPAQLAPLLTELAQSGLTPQQLQYGVSRLEEIYLELLADGEEEA